MDLTTCPECGHPAEVEWRAVLESTAGPIEHARIGCPQRHWFLLPVEWLGAAARPPVPAGDRGGSSCFTAAGRNALPAFSEKGSEPFSDARCSTGRQRTR